VGRAKKVEIEKVFQIGHPPQRGGRFLQKLQKQPPPEKKTNRVPLCIRHLAVADFRVSKFMEMNGNDRFPYLDLPSV